MINTSHSRPEGIFGGILTCSANGRHANNQSSIWEMSITTTSCFYGSGTGAGSPGTPSQGMSGHAFAVQTLLTSLPSEYLTIKFLTRPSSDELKITRDISERCRSPYISTLRDHFKIPHHLAKEDTRYRGIEFDAIVYPATGTDLRRISTPCEKPDVSLSLRRRKEVICHIVLGTAAMHNIGILHGGKLNSRRHPFCELIL